MGGPRVVVLLGPPGSGKGTQAARLCAELGVPHVATGDLFRENLAQGTELGERVRSYMQSGRLVPDELVTNMLFERVQDGDCASGFVLDGFPRTVVQAEALEERIRTQGWDASVYLLEVPDDVIVERAAGRVVCNSCGNVHHKRFSPPKVEGTCDRCGARELNRRDDDDPKVVRERLGVYHEETGPTVAFYRDRNRLEVIDGNRSMDEVQAELTRRIGRAA